MNGDRDRPKGVCRTKANRAKSVNRTGRGAAEGVSELTMLVEHEPFWAGEPLKQWLHGQARGGPHPEPHQYGI